MYIILALSSLFMTLSLFFLIPTFGFAAYITFFIICVPIMYAYLSRDMEQKNWWKLILATLISWFLSGMLVIPLAIQSDWFLFPNSEIWDLALVRYITLSVGCFLIINLTHVIIPILTQRKIYNYSTSIVYTVLTFFCVYYFTNILYLIKDIVWIGDLFVPLMYIPLFFVTPYFYIKGYSSQNRSMLDLIFLSLWVTLLILLVFFSFYFFGTTPDIRLT